MKSPARTTGCTDRVACSWRRHYSRPRRRRSGERRIVGAGMNSDDMHRPVPTIVRRGPGGRFITTMLATGALAACGGSDDASTATPGSDDAAATDPAGTDVAVTDAAGTVPAGGYTIVQRFPQAVQVPGALRLPDQPVGRRRGTAAGRPVDTRSTGATTIDGNRDRRSDRGDTPRRGSGPRTTTSARRSRRLASTACRSRAAPPTAPASTWPSRATVDGPDRRANRCRRSTRRRPTDPRGVDPICTREPEVCPFHDITLTEALAAGKPVVYYVGTPAFCSTGRVRTRARIDSSRCNRSSATRQRSCTPRCTPTDTATTLTPAVEALETGCSTNRCCSSPTRRV